MQFHRPAARRESPLSTAQSVPRVLRSAFHWLNTVHTTSTIPYQDLRCFRCAHKIPAVAPCSWHCFPKSTADSTTPPVPTAKKVARQTSATRTFLPARTPVPEQSISPDSRCTKRFCPPSCERYC